MTRDLLVGMFFLAALFLLGTMTFMKKGNPFAEKYTYHVKFNEVAGLKEGEQVRVRGHQIGKVGKMSVLDDGIRVPLILEQELPPRAGHSFQIASASTLGGRFVAYSPGTGTLSDPDSLVGTGDSAGMFDALNDFIEENRGSVRRIMSNVERITDQANEGKGLLGIILRDQDLAADAKATVASFRRIVGNIERGEGAIGALTSDPRLAASVRRTITNVEEISYKVNSGDGPLGMLVNDRELSASLKRITRRVEGVLNDVQYGSGLLPRLLSDGDLADKAGRIFTNLDEVTLDLREGQGLLPRLINDPAMAQNADESLSSVNEILGRINTGRGTIGKLVASDGLYRDLSSLLRTVREATEDFREQQPINTFVNVLFSAF